MDNPEKGSMTVAEAGARGGRSTAARHGPEFYEQIGRKGGKSTLERHGHEYFANLSRKGRATLKRLLEAGRKAMEDAGEDDFADETPLVRLGMAYDREKGDA